MAGSQFGDGVIYLKDSHRIRGLNVKIYNAVITVPCARLGIQHDGERVVNIDFVTCDISDVVGQDPFTQKIQREFFAYFADARHVPDVPVRARGTPFQMRVWDALRRIAQGETLTYGELARVLGSGPRAVAAACRANPVPIIIPCHRVVASNGLGGYSGVRDGDLFAIKPWLLRHEGVPVA